MHSTHPLKSILVMILTGAALGIGSNILHPKPIPWMAEEKKPVTLEQAGAIPDAPGETVDEGQKAADPPTP